jgi:hypothetical protein
VSWALTQDALLQKQKKSFVSIYGRCWSSVLPWFDEASGNFVCKQVCLDGIRLCASGEMSLFCAALHCTTNTVTPDDCARFLA